MAAVDPAIEGSDGEAAEATWKGEYDRFGNLTKITTQHPAAAETTRTIGTRSSTNRLTAAAYDGSGNVIGWDGREYRYDPFNMLWQTTANASSGHTFVYGPGDERIWAVDWSAGTASSNWIETWTLRDLDGSPLRQFRSVHPFLLQRPRVLPLQRSSVDPNRMGSADLPPARRGSSVRVGACLSSDLLMRRLQPTALLLSVLLLATAGPAWSDNCGAADHELWGKLLDAALVKTEEARSLIEQTAAEPPSEPVGRLAEILLEEWDLPADAEDLQQPRIVNSPEPDFSELWDDGLALQYFNVVVTGVVTSSGTVEEAEVKRGVGDSEVDQRCLEAFSRWCYRPALRGCGYVKKQVGAICHINPRDIETEPTGGQGRAGVANEPVRQDRQQPL